MRIIECLVCCGSGALDEGYDKWRCPYCHGHGEMNIREWLYWKSLDGDLRYKRGWEKFGDLLWKLSEIGKD